MHTRAATQARENGAEEDDNPYGRFNGTSGSLNSLPGLPHSNGSAFQSPARLSSEQGGSGETWYEVGRGKTYTPTAEDVGHVLKLECAAVDVSTGLAVGSVHTVLTNRVIPAPSPTPRRMICVSGNDGAPGMDIETRGASAGTFTVLSYNVLSDLYATSEMYSYCPPWALSWAYRRQNLLREIIGYRADILCLQEVW